MSSVHPNMQPKQTYAATIKSKLSNSECSPVLRRASQETEQSGASEVHPPNFSIAGTETSCVMGGSVLGSY